MGDPALYNELAPGNYTAIPRSPAMPKATGLVEVYDVEWSISHVV